MRYLALAADYDGTLALNGRVDDATIAALQRLRGTGRRILLVTGREPGELLSLFDPTDLCELVVAENGGVLYHPATKRIEPLADAPPEPFVAALRARHVNPLSVGHTIVATWTPNETVVLDVIRDLGLELHVIFNKGAVMVLPAAVNKASGLTAALGRLALSPHNVVAVGDGENDHSMLTLAECGCAVANAVPMLRATADWALTRDHGAGVAELIDALAANDLADRPPARHAFLLGTRGRDAVTITPCSTNLLVAGSPGSGTSALVAGLLERVAARKYQLCVVDPDGDYEALPQAMVLGGPEHPPIAAEVPTALETPEANVVVRLRGLPLHDRPGFVAGLLPRLQALRAATGRPHWVLVGDAHQLLPAGWEPAPTVVARELTGMIYVTVSPEAVEPALLGTVHVAAALGAAPDETLRRFAAAIGDAPPPPSAAPLAPGQALVWRRTSGEAPFVLDVVAAGAAEPRPRVATRPA